MAKLSEKKGIKYQRHKRFWTTLTETHHTFLRVYSMRMREASTAKTPKTERDEISQPPPRLPDSLWCLRNAKMLRIQPWEACQLNQHISFPLCRERQSGMRQCAWRGVLHFGCGDVPLCMTSRKFIPQNLLLCSFCLFLSLLHIVFSELTLQSRRTFQPECL